MHGEDRMYKTISRLLGCLRNSKKKPVPSSSTNEPVNFWDQCKEGLYVARFQKELESVAEKLSKENQPVLARLDPTVSAAEIYTAGPYGNGLVAHINVHGDCGVPYKMIVILLKTYREKNSLNHVKGIFMESLEYTGINIEFKTVS